MFHSQLTPRYKQLSKIRFDIRLVYVELSLYVQILQSEEDLEAEDRIIYAAVCDNKILYYTKSEV